MAPKHRRRPLFELLEVRALLTTFTVNVLEDIVDSDPSTMSLREAVIEANASAEVDTIVLLGATDSYVLDRVGFGEDGALTGDLDITDDVMIDGADAATTVIDAFDLVDRVFHVHPGVEVTISQVTIQGGEIDAFTGGVQGGGILNAGNLTLVDSVIRENSAQEGGGIASSGRLTVNGSTFVENFSEQQGGGIASTGPLAVDASTFRFNEAAGGAAIDVCWAAPTEDVLIADSTFTDNTSVFDGGAIAFDIEPDRSLIITNGVFERNVADDPGSQGGAIFANQGLVELENAMFLENSAAFGGAIFLDSIAEVSLSNSLLELNTASEEGGAIRTDGGVVSIVASTIRANVADSSGGGLSFGNETMVTISSSEVVDNLADEFGGGVYIEVDAEMMIIGTDIARNSAASGSGGGLFADAARLTIVDSSITDNSAESGGGLAIQEADVEVLNTTFTENSAISGGGAIDIDLDGALSLSDSLLRDNLADAGGAIRMGDSQVSVSGTSLLDNQADTGGAFRIDDGFGGSVDVPGISLNLIRSMVAGNVATDSGGAVYVEGSELDLISVTVQQSTVSGNLADGEGGGFFQQEHSSITITNSTLSGNGAVGAGGAVFSEGQLQLNASTVVLNSASTGGGLNLPSSADAQVGLSIIADNLGIAPDLAGAVTSTGYNLIGDGTGSSGFGAPGDQVGTSGSPIDPLLGPLQDNSGETPTHALLVGSPAIDAGSVAGAPPTDQRGVPRPQGAEVDIGSFELKAAPNTPPTTTGIADVEVAEDAPNTVIDLFAAFDDDQDADAAMTYVVQLNTNSGLFDSTDINGVTGELTLDYAADVSGAAEVTVRATDTGSLFVETTFTVTVLTAEEQIDGVSSTVEDLKDAGVLSNGQANPLLNFLDQALKDLDKGKVAKAIQKLNDFIDRVQGLIEDGELTAAEGQPLIDTAGAAIRAALPGSPLLASAAASAPEIAQRLTASQLDSAIGQAISYWRAHNANHEATSRLSQVSVFVANLPGRYLGAASAEAVWIDHNASGHGWSFDGRSGSGVDLLSAVTHEFGHVLGLEHRDGGIMHATLETAVQQEGLAQYGSSPQSGFFRSLAHGRGPELRFESTFRQDEVGRRLLLDKAIQLLFLAPPSSESPARRAPAVAREFAAPDDQNERDELLSADDVDTVFEIF